MATIPPTESDGGSIEPGRFDEPEVFDTSDPNFDDEDGRGKQLVESMPLPFKRLVEVYREIDTQARDDFAVLFVREPAEDAEPTDDEDVPADFVGDLSDFDDSPPAWIRRHQDEYLCLIVCYLDAKGCEDWNIPSTSLVFAVEWVDALRTWEWCVRLPGIMANSPGRSRGYKVLDQDGVVGLLAELQAIIAAPFLP